MGKRSDFPKIDKDAYMTFDPRAAKPLMDYAQAPVSYYEPCVGNGDLVNLLWRYQCVGRSDVEHDARTTIYDTQADYFITNPPWTRSVLHPIIENPRTQRPTWLLFDAAYMFTAQSAQYMKYCKVVIAVGRLLWIPGTTMTGKDDCAWYLFDKEPSQTVFIGRQPK